MKKRNNGGGNPAMRIIGPGHVRFGTGMHVSDKGYLRYSSGPLRNRYVHRVALAELCAEWCYYPLDPRTGLPFGMTVEHVDHHKQHNCISNLLLLDIRIHNALSWRSWLNTPVLGDIEFADGREITYPEEVEAAEAAEAAEAVEPEVPSWVTDPQWHTPD